MHICPYCQREYKSYKSWHRHKSLSHKDQIISYQQMHQEYDANPKLCKQCSKPISFDKKNANQFCSSSCSTSFNNQSRDVSNKVRHTWRAKLGKSLRTDPKPKRLVTCKCGNIFKPKFSQKFCRPSCNISKVGKSRYRLLCTFELNNREHSELYNRQLLEKHGWYCPANKGEYNPDGATWDHLFRVSDGFAAGVDPEIMRHPANAEMVSWRDNQRRKVSQITYEELLERISVWNAKHPPQEKP